MLKKILTNTLSRRGLLKLGGFLSAPFLVGTLGGRRARASGDTTPGYGLVDSYLQSERETYWSEDGEYFVQPTVDPSRVGEGVISARVDGTWSEFPIRSLSDSFVTWNFRKRLAILEAMTTGALDMYNDIHNAAVATHGARRGDSCFSLNVAYKGTGWVPKPEHIETMTQVFWDHRNASMPTKLAILEANYRDQTLWRRDMIGSLELYTTKAFETHSFLNQMANPLSVICFHDTISYEVRCIAQLMHPADPDLTEEQWAIHQWINYAHDFFHGMGQLRDDRISVVYWVVEQFDKSPWGQTSTAGGHRVVPPM